MYTAISSTGNVQLSQSFLGRTIFLQFWCWLSLSSILHQNYHLSTNNSSTLVVIVATAILSSTRQVVLVSPWGWDTKESDVHVT